MKNNMHRIEKMKTMKTKNILNSILVMFFALSVNSTLAQEVDRSKAPEPGEAPVINIPKPQLFELDNGLQVIVVEDHSLPRVAWRLYVDYDPILEKDKTGILQAFGQSMGTGTTSKTKVEIDDATDFIGASINFSSRGFYASSLTKHQDEMLSILKDILFNPTFPSDELDKIKKQMVSNIKNNKSSASTMASNVRRVVNFGTEHPYGEVETVETVENIKSEDLKKFYGTYFKPNISYLVVVGDINKEQAEEKIKSMFGSWEKGDVPTHKYKQPQLPSGNKVVFVEKKGAVQSEIRVTFPVQLKPGADDAIAASVMNSILGGGIFSGRLMQNLREDKAFTYGCRSTLDKDELTGEFYTFGSFRNEVSDSAITEILYEVNRITDELVSDDELSLTLNSMNGSFARSLESAQTIANFALNTIRYDLPEDYYQNYLTNLSKVTKEDVRNAAKKYLHPDNAYIVVAGSKDITDKLKKFSSDGKIDERDMYGNVKKDLEPAPEGVTAQSVINDYLKAYTMEDKMKKVEKKFKKLKSIQQEMTATVQGGMQLSFKSYQAAPNKESQIISMNGMTVQKQYFNGETGGATGMQGASELTEEEIKAKKVESRMDAELKYDELGYKMELLGVNKVGEHKTYKIKLTSPEGTVSFKDYDVDSHLLIRTETIVETPEGPSSSVILFSDYKEYDGFMFPSKMEIESGPQTIEAEVKSVEVNGKIDDAVFNK